jgi:hypothetical protein
MALYENEPVIFLHIACVRHLPRCKLDQGSSVMSRNVGKYQPTQRNIPEERKPFPVLKSGVISVAGMLPMQLMCVYGNTQVIMHPPQSYVILEAPIIFITCINCTYAEKMGGTRSADGGKERRV